MIEEENLIVDDGYEEEGLVLPTQYTQIPEARAALINTATGEVSAPEQYVSCWEFIETNLRLIGANYRQPVKGCKKCFGRGWIGRKADTKEPIVCNCVFVPKTKAEQIMDAQMENNYRVPFMNRADKRRAMKNMAKMLKKRMITDE